ncbi:MAG: peptidase dimerization domain-containing protein [Verrucomicrobiota bacterium]
MLRTTAVATQFNGGHADNASLSPPEAVVNCRILPEDSPDEVEATLRRILSDDQIEVTRMDEPRPSPPSPSIWK